MLFTGTCVAAGGAGCGVAWPSQRLLHSGWLPGGEDIEVQVNFFDRDADEKKLG
jgi:hypothetical protein